MSTVTGGRCIYPPGRSWGSAGDRLLGAACKAPGNIEEDEADSLAKTSACATNVVGQRLLGAARKAPETLEVDTVATSRRGRANRRRGRQLPQRVDEASGKHEHERSELLADADTTVGQMPPGLLAGNQFEALADDECEVVAECFGFDEPVIAKLRAEEATILSDVEGIAAMVVYTPFAQAMLKSQSEWCGWRLTAIRAELATLTSGAMA